MESLEIEIVRSNFLVDVDIKRSVHTIQFLEATITLIQRS